MARVENASRLVEKLKYRAKGAGRAFAVNVGYSAPYAVFVHENLAMPHANGQAKFLEQPARAMRAQMVTNVKRWMTQGKTQEEAMAIEGLRLMRASQALVPVRTGFLKNSAFSVVRR